MIFSGFLLDKAIQCAYLAVHEICQLSTTTKQTAEQISHHVSMHSMDIAKFVKPVYVGEILEFRAQIIYVCPKSNRVRIRVVAETIDPLTGKSLTEEANTFQMTYSVSTEIRLKQVMPTTYKQSLLYLQGMREMQS
jgi:acyl-CoA hydrolase